MNILITNIGRRGYLVDFIKSLKNFEGNVYVSDCDRTASGLYGNCAEFFILDKPVDNENNYVKQLMELCIKKKITLVIPVIDPEIYILSKYREMFRKKGITVLVSDKTVLEICHNKLEMNVFLASHGFNVVRSYDNIESFQDGNRRGLIRYPIFIKPIYGSGSVHSLKVESEDELRAFFKEGMIIQEFLDGDEYGIDAFVDDRGIPVRLVVKQKISMRSGETDKAITVLNEKLKSEVLKLVSILQPFGPLDCDVIETLEGVYIIDLNPRFGGGYPATHMAGIDFIELALKLSANEAIEPIFNNYIVGQLTMKDIGIKTVNISEDKYTRGKCDE